MAENKQDLRRPVTRTKSKVVAPSVDVDAVDRRRPSTRTKKVLPRRRSRVDTIKREVVNEKIADRRRAVEQAEELISEGKFDVKSLQDYEQRYEETPANVQQVLITPTELKQSQEQKAGTLKEKIDNKIKENREAMQRSRDREKNVINKYSERLSRLSTRYNQGKMSAERYQEQRQRLELDRRRAELQEREKYEYYQSETEKLQEAKEKISPDVTPEFGDVLKDAMQYGEHRESVLRQRHAKRLGEFGKDLEIKKYKALGYDPNFHVVTKVSDPDKISGVVTMYNPEQKKFARIGKFDYDRADVSEYKPEDLKLRSARIAMPVSVGGTQQWMTQVGDVYRAEDADVYSTSYEGVKVGTSQFGIAPFTKKDMKLEDAGKIKIPTRIPKQSLQDTDRVVPLKELEEQQFVSSPDDVSDDEVIVEREMQVYYDPEQERYVSEQGEVLPLKKAEKEKKSYAPFYTVDRKTLPLDYGLQGSISTSPSNIVLSEQEFEKVDDATKRKKLADYFSDYVSMPFKYISDRMHIEPSIVYGGSPSLPIAIVSPISFGKKDEPVITRKVVNRIESAIGEESKNIDVEVIGEDKVKDYEKIKEEEWGKTYQSAFESSPEYQSVYREFVPVEEQEHYKQEMEEAAEKFAQTPSAKLVMKKYGEDYSEGYKEMQQEIKYTPKGFYAGSKLFGLGILSLGVKSFKSPAHMVVGGATVLGLSKAYGALPILSSKAGLAPETLTTAIGVGFTAHGLKKAFDPEATYQDVASGLIIAGISGGGVARTFYKGYKQPVPVSKTIPQKQIMKPKIPVGKRYKIITDEGMIDKIVYDKQLLREFARGGKYTEVYRRGDLFIEKISKSFSSIYRDTPLKIKGFLGYKAKPLYSPFKSSQAAYLRGGDESIWKSFYSYRPESIQIAQSDYQRVFSLLKKYGYTDAQARTVLKYQAPRVYRQYIEKGELTIKDGQVIGKVDYVTKQPKIDYNYFREGQKFNVYTRPGSTIKETDIVYAKNIPLNVNIKNLYKNLEIIDRKTYVLGKGGKRLYSLESDVGTAINTRKILSEVKTESGDIIKKEQIDTVYSPKQVARLDLTKQSKFLQDLTTEKSRTFIYNKGTIDMTSTGKKIVRTGTKKTPLTKTFSDDVLKDIKNIIQNNKKVTDKTAPITKKSSFQQVSKEFQGYAESRYAGTGMYERSEFSSSSMLKTKQYPEISLPKAHSPVIPKIKSFTAPLIKSKSISGLLSFIGEISTQKLDTKQQNMFNVTTTQRLIQRSTQDQEVNQAVDSDSVTRTDSITDTDVIIEDVVPRQPTIRTPRPTTARTPKSKPVPMFLPWLPLEGFGKGEEDESKNIEQYALTPDFTARALGFKPKGLTKKKAVQETKKVKTGAEIRTGVNIKELIGM